MVKDVVDELVRECALDVTSPFEFALRRESRPPAPSGARESIAKMRRAYRLALDYTGRRSDPLTFVRFVLSYYQHSWGTRTRWRVPLVGAVKLARSAESMTRSGSST